MSDYVIGFIVGYAALVVVGIVWGRVSAWRKSRAAKQARPSATIKGMDRTLRALYSSAALEEMAKQEHPLFTNSFISVGAVKETGATAKPDDLDFDGVTRALTPDRFATIADSYCDLERMIEERTKVNPRFPEMLAEAVKRREAARGIVFKPGKPLNPVPTDEPKDGES